MRGLGGSSPSTAPSPGPAGIIGAEGCRPATRGPSVREAADRLRERDIVQRVTSDCASSDVTSGSLRDTSSSATGAVEGASGAQRDAEEAGHILFESSESGAESGGHMAREEPGNTEWRRLSRTERRRLQRVKAHAIRESQSADVGQAARAEASLQRTVSALRGVGRPGGPSAAATAGPSGGASAAAASSAATEPGQTSSTKLQL